MSGLATICRLALADLLERSRRYGLLVTIAATVWFASICLPPQGATYTTIGFGDWRGVYNSAWVGGVFAVLTSVLLSLPGFYLVKNAVARDRATGVGQILAATPVGRWMYLSAKAASNLAYLSLMTGTLVIAAFVMQLARGEDRAVDPWGLVSPFVLVVTPAMAVVGALAVLFESVRVLSGSLGNVVFFFTWMGLLVANVGFQSRTPDSAFTSDLFGASLVVGSMAEAAKPVFPGGNPIASAHVGFEIHTEPGWKAEAHTFVWSGVRWTPGRLAARLGWLLSAFGITAIASLFFDRFDTEERGARPAPAPPPRAAEGRDRAGSPATIAPGPASAAASQSGGALTSAAGPVPSARATQSVTVDDASTRATRLSGPLESAAADGRSSGAASFAAPHARRLEAPASHAHVPALTPLSAAPRAPRLPGIVAAELRLSLKGVSRWWYVVAIGLAVASALVPAGQARAMVLSIAWLWPLPLFSAMGCRERQFGVEEILASAPHPLRAQLTGTWLAGVGIAALAGAGVALRLAATADVRALVGWAAGALFVPSLALALGVLSGTPRLFEVVYLLLWYAGPMNRVPVLDYGGFTAEGLARGMPFSTLAIAAVSVASAFTVRALRARR